MRFQLYGGITASLGLAAVLIAAAPPHNFAPPRNFASPIYYGDVDGDGAITLADALQTLKISVGLVSPPPDQIQRADIFPFPGIDGRPIGDGAVDTRDAIAVLKIAVGLAGPPDVGPPVNTVSFSHDVVPIFQNRGCETSFCHGGRLPRGGMKLVAGQEFAVIVNVESLEAPGVARIKPGDPDHSYLLAKLMDTQESLGGSGARMPAGEGLIPQPLPDAEIATVRHWILEGAPDN